MLSIIPLLVSFQGLGAQTLGTAEGIPRCEAVPMAEHQVSFRIDGEEVTRWRFGPQYPRPFFYPVLTPSGAEMTRMGHPGAPNHDHHRSVWFASHDVGGEDFWSENGGTRIRQREWFSYVDGAEEAVMSAALDWEGADGRVLLTQELVVAVAPMNDGWGLEVQSTFRPAGDSGVSLGKTNFGILAVRVSKSLSHHFGAGQLTDSAGRVGEPSIFGRRARWMDYSGRVPVGVGADRELRDAGLTLFDHPENPRYPTRWHVRSDGWMGASFCYDEGWELTQERPLRLRYLLYVRDGALEVDRLEAVAREFRGRPGFDVRRSSKPHLAFETVRE